MKKIMVIAPIMGVLLLAACSTSDATTGAYEATGAPHPSSSTRSTTSASPAKVSKELESIKNRFTNEGFKCDDWEVTSSFSMAEASGACSNGVRIGYFKTKKDIDKQLEISKKWAEDNDVAERTWVVGEDWIIEAKKSKNIQKDLGGKVVKV